MGIYTKDDQEALFNLQIDDTAKSYFLEMARWGKFLGIIAAIMIILASIFMGFLMMYYLPTYTSMPVSGGVIEYIITVLIVIAIDFYPIFAILKFSALSKKAVTLNNQEALNNALRYLKNIFKYFGIITIIIIVFYGIALLISILGALQ